MKASEARKLRVGDSVRVHFSNSEKTAMIGMIEWPRFWVAAELKSGELACEIRHYRTLKKR